MRNILFGLSLVFANLITPVAYAYEPSSVTQCSKQTPKQSSLQNLVHKVAIQIDQGERKCKDINGEWSYDCRTTFVRNIINKGKECGHQGSNKEIYEDYKKKAYQAYSFGGFELHGYRNGKKVVIPADCTGFAPDKGVVAGSAHCFKDHDFQKISDLAKKGKVYYKYINKHGRTTRVELDVYRTKEVGPRDEGFVLFKTKSEIQRSHFMKLPPRGTTHQDLQTIIDKKNSMEIVSQVNKDWTKTLKEKKNKKPRRQLHSKCSPGNIDSTTYSMSTFTHSCDTFKGSSGAPLLTEVNLCTPQVSSPTLLGIHFRFDGPDNLATSMSGSNLEEIYKFIDEVK